MVDFQPAMLVYQRVSWFTFFLWWNFCVTPRVFHDWTSKQKRWYKIGVRSIWKSIHRCRSVAITGLQRFLLDIVLVLMFGDMILLMVMKSNSLPQVFYIPGGDRRISEPSTVWYMKWSNVTNAHIYRKRVTPQTTKYRCPGFSVRFPSRKPENFTHRGQFST